MHIGIDVGGTNTDAVLVEDGRVLASVKTATTADVTGGLAGALAELLDGRPDDRAAVRAVAIGTTHFTNAVVQARDLAPTAAVRLGLPAGAGVPPMTGWPEHLVAALGGHVHMVRGGHEFDGREIAPLDEDALRRIAAGLGAAGVTSVAVTGIFSPVVDHTELRAAQVLQEEVPHLRVSLSHQIGRIGLLERENATIINAALLPLAATTTRAISAAIEASGLTVPLYLSQNDGTLMDVDHVRAYPVATFAAGPTNSMRGAAVLTGLTDCLVVDVGGTTTDVGAIVGGFPRPASTEVDIGGVRTNFRMPDVVSTGIGGGSLVGLGAAHPVGPRSVGFRVHQEALVFGGTTLTATDLAVAGGLVELGDPGQVAGLDRVEVRRALSWIATRVGQLADTMRTSAEPVPLVLVGGGAVLLGDDVPGFDTVVRPEGGSVANAVGAAIAQVGGEVDHVVRAGGRDRATLVEQACEEAVARAVLAGATPSSVTVVEVEELPIAYLPGDSLRLRVRAVGDLDLRAPARDLTAAVAR